MDVKNFPALSKFEGQNDIVRVIKDEPALAEEIEVILSAGKFYDFGAKDKLGKDLVVAFRRFKKSAFLEHPTTLGATTAKELLEVVGIGEHATPSDNFIKVPQKSDGTELYLPTGGFVRCDARIDGSKHFTWGEATKNGTRVPINKQVVGNIIRTAVYMDTVRAFLGNRPTSVNSWYRPLHINRSVGSFDTSTHVYGLGVDFTVLGIPPLEVYRMLHGFHGSIGGLGKSEIFCHLDRRGYGARWRYN